MLLVAVVAAGRRVVGHRRGASRVPGDVAPGLGARNVVGAEQPPVVGAHQERRVRVPPSEPDVVQPALEQHVGDRERERGVGPGAHQPVVGLRREPGGEDRPPRASKGRRKVAMSRRNGEPGAVQGASSRGIVERSESVGTAEPGSVRLRADAQRRRSKMPGIHELPAAHRFERSRSGASRDATVRIGRGRLFAYTRRC